MKVHAAITAIANYLPDEILTNAELEKMVDTTSEWILDRSGIAERRIMKDKTKATAFMGAEAAKKILAKRGISPLDIELIIVCTATPEYQFPSTGNIIGDMIGAKNAWSFDIMAACSGFIYALNTASKFIETGTHKNVLVIGSDKMSTVVDFTDRNNCVLFGDAAAAVLLEPNTEGNGVIDAKLYSDGSGLKYLSQTGGGSLNPPNFDMVELRQHFMFMDGKPVFKIAVTKMAESAAEMMERNNLKSEDVAWLVPHQANKRIIEATAARMGVGMDKVMLNIEKYGNTTCASIPNCMTEWESKLKKGDNLILVAFGAGFTWGGLYLKWAY
jgi:3-oxoacyl-[acyl-carrier-protein] synthase-3